MFFLNFNDGGRDLRLNAEVVQRALDRVHALCPQHLIALAGMSMGGLISRYALAHREEHGIAHNVGVFISYDSPQHYAHANPWLQDYIAGLDPGLSPVVTRLQGMINNKAARQMLGYNPYDPDHVDRNEFFDELDALNTDGYPHHSYNVAVSNGKGSSPSCQCALMPRRVQSLRGEY